MPLLHHPVALDELYRMALLREAWTDFGDFGVVRRAGLGKIDKFSVPEPPRGRSPMLPHSSHTTAPLSCVGALPPVHSLASLSETRYLVPRNAESLGR